MTGSAVAPAVDDLLGGCVLLVVVGDDEGAFLAHRQVGRLLVGRHAVDADERPPARPPPAPRAPLQSPRLPSCRWQPCRRRRPRPCRWTPTCRWWAPACRPPWWPARPSSPGPSRRRASRPEQPSWRAPCSPIGGDLLDRRTLGRLVLDPLGGGHPPGGGRGAHRLAAVLNLSGRGLGRRGASRVRHVLPLVPARARKNPTLAVWESGGAPQNYSSIVTRPQQSLRSGEPGLARRHGTKRTASSVASSRPAVWPSMVVVTCSTSASRLSAGSAAAASTWASPSSRS